MSESQRSGASAWWQARGLATRMVLSFGSVIVAVAVTVFLIAPSIGTAEFERRMSHNGGRGSMMSQAEDLSDVFAQSSAWALAIGLIAAVLVATAVSIALARRVGSSLGSLNVAVHRVAEGELGTQVEPPGMGREFDELADSFNLMSARLAQSEHLRKRMIGDVAHELRTPVATISGYLEGLEDGVADLTPETIAILRAQTVRLTRLAEDLSALTHAESGEVRLDRRRVEPASLLEHARAAGADRARAAGVELRVEADGDLPHVDVDPDRMAQVLGNLVDNAVRHTPEGGAVTLRARRAGDAVEIAVADTGTGISQEHLPHVFERFYRADDARDRASGGSGIGLSIVKALVEAHGGAVRADSGGADAGATFTVSLPGGRL